MSCWDWLPDELKEKIRFHTLDLMIPVYYNEIKPKMKLLHNELEDQTFCIKYTIGYIREEIMGNVFSKNVSRKWHVINLDNSSCVECLCDKE